MLAESEKLLQSKVWADPTALGFFGGAVFGVAGLTTAATVYTWERMKSKFAMVDFVMIKGPNGKVTMKFDFEKN